MFLTSTRLFIIVSRLLVDGYYKKRMITAPELADFFNVNKRALMPALHRLTQAGYLRSQIGGSTPGFRFTKDPKEINTGEIIRNLEGEMKMDSCRDLIPNVNCICDSCTNCLFYNKINQMIDDERKKLYKISLFDLFADTKLFKDLTQEEQQVIIGQA